MAFFLDDVIPDQSLFQSSGSVRFFSGSCTTRASNFSDMKLLKKLEQILDICLGIMIQSYLQTSPVLVIIPAVSYRLFIIVCHFKWWWLFGMTRGSMVRCRGFRCFLFRTWDKNPIKIWENLILSFCCLNTNKQKKNQVNPTGRYQIWWPYPVQLLH